MEIVKLKVQDEYELNLHVFEVPNPKGVIQVLHGMEEHQERYERLVFDLNANGYSVVTANMRGHGEDAPLLGYFGDNGASLLVNDQVEITRFIKERYNVEKVIIFAHSMGTITTRNLLMEHSNDYSKVILSGYPCPMGAASVGVVLSNIIKAFKGAKHYSKLLENLAVGSFNKAVKNPKTDFDWISYNEANVNAYIEDKYCGHGFTVNGCNALFTLVANMGKAKLYKDVNKELPFLLISGEDDPCTGKEKGRNASLSILNKAGFNDIKVITYPHMRHEILNEEDFLLVHKDIIEYLS